MNLHHQTHPDATQTIQLDFTSARPRDGKSDSTVFYLILGFWFSLPDRRIEFGAAPRSDGAELPGVTGFLGGAEFLGAAEFLTLTRASSTF